MTPLPFPILCSAGWWRMEGIYCQSMTSLCFSFFFTLFPCSSMWFLQWDTVLKELLCYIAWCNPWSLLTETNLATSLLSKTWTDKDSYSWLLPSRSKAHKNNLLCTNPSASQGGTLYCCLDTRKCLLEGIKTRRDVTGGVLLEENDQYWTSIAHPGLHLPSNPGLGRLS